MHVEMRPQVNERENYQHASNAQGSLLPSAESSQLNALSQVRRPPDELCSMLHVPWTSLIWQLAWMLFT